MIPTDLNDLEYEEWVARAQRLRPEGRAYIGGEYRDAAGGSTFPSINPANVVPWVCQ